MITYNIKGSVYFEIINALISLTSMVKLDTEVYITSYSVCLYINTSALTKTHSLIHVLLYMIFNLYHNLAHNCGTQYHVVVHSIKMNVSIYQTLCN